MFKQKGSKVGFKTNLIKFPVRVKKSLMSLLFNCCSSNNISESRQKVQTNKLDHRQYGAWFLPPAQWNARFKDQSSPIALEEGLIIDILFKLDIYGFN